MVATDFDVSYDEQGTREDPPPRLREGFGESLVGVDLDGQSVLLRGDDFERWGPLLRFYEGALLPIFRGGASPDVVRQVCSRAVRLTSGVWPSELRAVLHMWDDI